MGKRRVAPRLLRAVLATALLHGVVTAASADYPPLPQDDWGSGGDAPDDFATALPVSPPLVEGELFGGAVRPLGATAGDVEDWYRFPLSPGQRLDFRIERVPLSGLGVINLQVVAPDGVVVWSTFADSGDEALVAGQAGEYRFRVSMPLSGLLVDPVPAEASLLRIQYRISWGVQPAAGLAGAAHGPGYLVFSFDLHTTPFPCAAVTGHLWSRAGGPSQRPLGITWLGLGYHGLRADSNVWAGSTPGAAVTAGDRHVEQRLEQHGANATVVIGIGTWQGSPEAIVHGCGPTYLVALVDGSWSQTSYQLQLGGDSRLLGVGWSGRDSSRFLRTSDLSADPSAQAFGTTVNGPSRLDVGAERGLIGLFDCSPDPSCQIGAPAAGEPIVRQFEGGVAAFWGQGGGSWRFERGGEAGSGGERLILMAADVAVEQP